MRILLSTLATLLALGPPAQAFDLDTLLTTPRQDACTLFDTEQEFVRFYLDMEMEGTQIAMRIPKVFFEDRSDHQNDAHHRAQLFSVMLDSFLPIIRAQEGAFNKSLPWPRGHQRHMHFLVQDVIDLNGILDVRLGLRLLDPLVDYRDVFTTDRHEYRLKKLRSINPNYDVRYRQEAFIVYAEDGSLQTVMTCNIDGSVPYPGCTIVQIKRLGCATQLPQTSSVQVETNPRRHPPLFTMRHHPVGWVKPTRIGCNPCATRDLTPTKPHGICP